MDSLQHSSHAMPMTGMFGPYAMTREGSGTSWQPDATPHEGLHLMKGGWMLMLHGSADGIYDYQGGTRGDSQFFSANMLMGMAQRSLGPGTFGARAMLSLEPLTIGNAGYPLLLQTGETADGKTHLIDRQHPHDLLMELAVSYSVPFAKRGAVFGYFGLPGEPALGPAAFMHRFAGMQIPEAPISHHWLDSTHITFGVATAGVVWSGIKLDASLFTGREPDQFRWGFDPPRFDSYSVRLSYNPTPALAMQASYGHIVSPEQLEPDVNVDRVTASVTYHKRWDENDWQSTLAWGRNMAQPGESLDAFLLESSLRLHAAHNIFARAERVDKDELFTHDDPMDGQVFTVNKLSAGYRFDFLSGKTGRWGIGALGSVHVLPDALEPAYGSPTPLSFMIFTRLQLGGRGRG